MKGLGYVLLYFRNCTWWGLNTRSDITSLSHDPILAATRHHPWMNRFTSLSPALSPSKSWIPLPVWKNGWKKANNSITQTFHALSNQVIPLPSIPCLYRPCSGRQLPITLWCGIDDLVCDSSTIIIVECVTSHPVLANTSPYQRPRFTARLAIEACFHNVTTPILEREFWVRRSQEIITAVFAFATLWSRGTSTAWCRIWSQIPGSFTGFVIVRLMKDSLTFSMSIREQNGIRTEKWSQEYNTFQKGWHRGETWVCDADGW